MGNQENANNAPQQDLNELLKIRREKLQTLQENGKDPFVITKYNQEHHSDEVKALYEKIGGTITYWFNGQQLDLSPNNYSIGEVTELPIPELDGFIFSCLLT